jgi:hypothetical protein
MSRCPGGVSSARYVRGRPSKRLTSAHHARRLSKLGRSAQRTPPDDRREWAAEHPSRRAGNAIDVLIEVAASPGSQAWRAAAR